ncbi:hypothetical protein BO71DRAFT_338610, partial [Aspergillus ellipticus CBS 707.79]
MFLFPLLLAFLLALAGANQLADPLGVVPATTADPTPHGPTLNGTASDCNQWYTVQKDDTCDSVEKTFSITAQQFQQWNPSVPLDCGKNFWLGYSYCVGVGPGSSQPATVPPSSQSHPVSTSSPVASSAPVTSPMPSSPVPTSYSTRHPITSYNITAPPVDTAWPPTRTQAGQPATCDNWYLVKPGDNCDSIFRKFSRTMTKNELLEWNPVLKDDCDYPSTGYYVCVSIQRPGMTFVYPTGDSTVIVPSPTEWTPRPTPTWSGDDKGNSTFPPSPTQPGIPTGCASFYQAKKGDTCDDILHANPRLEMPLLHRWNPALFDDCSGIITGYYYCISAYDGLNLPFPPTVTTQPYPTKQGIAQDCTGWYQRRAGDTCDMILNSFGTFDKQQFVAWNPSVGLDCLALDTGVWYCISDATTPKTRTRPVPPPTIPTDVPRQPSVTKDCKKWWFVSNTDTCITLAVRNGIKLVDFYTWNPDITAGCKNLQVGTEVCVGISSAKGGSSSGIPSSSG